VQLLGQLQERGTGIHSPQSRLGTAQLRQHPVANQDAIPQFRIGLDLPEQPGELAPGFAQTDFPHHLWCILS